MRWFKRLRIYGRQNTVYMTRVYLPWGYKLHRFYRGDEDRDPHDHPWGFWTFPLTSYYEEYWPDDGRGYPTASVRLVRAFRWHYRPATHRHRVLGRQPYYAPGTPQRILTLVKTDRAEQEWGFWTEDGIPGVRRKIPWRQYLGLPPDAKDPDQ